ncbi:MAG TPA: cytochrome ubiquinol oxidase subunit I [Xanthomonadales bacterium]|nr:cytochrome ubiquinol oxidase subunit I [Xanthomonadales bacterium]
MPETLLLSRIQFAANISFHILFPMITIALAWVLLFFKLRFSATGDEKWMNAYRLWVKVFALTFALGVVSGVTMSFQFGTNWPGYMETVGNIAGPLLAYEVLTAFFLEAAFLGIMLFGFKRVGNRMHTLATLLVAVGTSLSAFWILALVSWMHTPAGFEMRDGVAHATNWFEIVFNPSFTVRLAHTMLASFLTVAFLLAGISAYRLLRKDDTPAVRTTLRVGVWLAAILVPIQIFIGDLHGLNTQEHQPAKIAAMEGLWETRERAPLVLFGMPDEETQQNRYAVEIPGLASLILKHDIDGEVLGLNEFPDAHPPVAAVFWSFRVMVGIGVLMLLMSWWATWAMRKGRLPSAMVQRGLAWMTFSGWIAVLAGWYTTEIGRQPYLVYGVLKTADAVTDISAANVGLTLTMYLGIYSVLLFAYISVVFYLARQAGKPEVKASQPVAHGPNVIEPARLSASESGNA